jgi:hypothetical protein
MICLMGCILCTPTDRQLSHVSTSVLSCMCAGEGVRACACAWCAWVCLSRTLCVVGGGSAAAVDFDALANFVPTEHAKSDVGGPSKSLRLFCIIYVCTMQQSTSECSVIFRFSVVTL